MLCVCHNKNIVSAATSSQKPQKTTLRSSVMHFKYHRARKAVTDTYCTIVDASTASLKQAKKNRSTEKKTANPSFLLFFSKTGLLKIGLNKVTLFASTNYKTYFQNIIELCEATQKLCLYYSGTGQISVRSSFFFPWRHHTLNFEISQSLECQYAAK